MELTLYPKLITDALATVTYPGTKKNLIDSNMLADDVRIDGMKVKFTLIFPRDTDPFLKSTLKAAEAAIHYHVSKDVEVTIETEFASKPRPEVGKMLPQVKNVLCCRRCACRRQPCPFPRCFFLCQDSAQCSGLRV